MTLYILPWLILLALVALVALGVKGSMSISLPVNSSRMYKPESRNEDSNLYSALFSTSDETEQ